MHMGAEQTAMAQAVKIQQLTVRWREVEPLPIGETWGVSVYRGQYQAERIIRRNHRSIVDPLTPFLAPDALIAWIEARIGA